MRFFFNKLLDFHSFLPPLACAYKSQFLLDSVLSVLAWISNFLASSYIRQYLSMLLYLMETHQFVAFFILKTQLHESLLPFPQSSSYTLFLLKDSIRFVTTFAISILRQFVHSLLDTHKHWRNAINSTNEFGFSFDDLHHPNQILKAYHGSAGLYEGGRYYTEEPTIFALDSWSNFMFQHLRFILVTDTSLIFKKTAIDWTLWANLQSEGRTLIFLRTGELVFQLDTLSFVLRIVVVDPDLIAHRCAFKKCVSFNQTSLLSGMTNWKPQFFINVSKLPGNPSVL